MRKDPMAHDGDCRIYAADYPYCSCGLLHFLDPLEERESLYPGYWRDIETQESWMQELTTPMPEPKPKSPQEQAKIDEALKTCFGELIDADCDSDAGPSGD